MKDRILNKFLNLSEWQFFLSLNLGWRISKILSNPKDLRRKFKKMEIWQQYRWEFIEMHFVKLEAAADL